MFWKKDEKLRQELDETKERLQTLEKDHHSLVLTMQNLQSAILAMSRNQDTVAQDVRVIQEMVTHFLHEIDPAQIMFGYSSSSDDN
jgi:translation initiation factor 2B subunit (eIF-2B alpha/beta/delta family)